MTWSRVVQSPVSVQAWKTEVARGEKRVQLTVGSSSAFLTEDDAASLGGYLMGVTNNPPPQPEVYETPFPTETVTVTGSSVKPINTSEYEQKGA